jgi:hypothetical protein
MLTLFSTPKPFRGHIAIIQRNALKSWKLLHPDAEVILFGNEEGAEEVCRELDLRYEPDVERSRLGTVRADSLFSRAQEIARHDLLCYSNCDIVLRQDFLRALKHLQAWRATFLMVGRRWDTDIVEPIDFFAPDWERKMVERAKSEGIQRFYHNIDYFAFPRGLYREMPALVVGRKWWDHWMVWNALDLGHAVVDASNVACAVHQNHDYSHVPEGWKSVANDEDAQRNFVLAGGHVHQRTIEDATFRLTPAEIVPNRFAWLAPAKRRWRNIRRAVRGALRTRIWHPLLGATRPVRRAMGLKKNTVPGAMRSGERRHWMDQ